MSILNKFDAAVEALGHCNAMSPVKAGMKVEERQQD